MNDSELYRKASQAAHDYRTVHGSFPEKIGIHHERLHSFPYRQILFAEMTELPAALFSLESLPLESTTYKRHVAMFEPVIGEAIEYDEVYMPVPGDKHAVVNSRDIAYYARQKEREVKARYHYKAKRDEVYRIVQAESQEEVDVCRECYRFYLPMRKLQEIYDDLWKAPRCAYCEKLAKYHVKRSDWITFEKVETK